MCFIQQPFYFLVKVQSIYGKPYLLFTCLHTCPFMPDQSPIYLIYYLRVYTLAHSCLSKVQSIFSNRKRLFITRCSSSKKSADHIDLLFCFTQLPSDMFAGKFVSHFLFVADDVICRGLVRSCPCDLALFCKQLFCACV